MTILGCRTEVFFFYGKKSWSYCFLGWNLPEITVMLQLFQHYFGITDKSRKNRIFHRFFYYWPWSRNNYVMIPTTWQFPVNFTPKNHTSKLNFEKKKFFYSRKGSQVRSQNRKTTILWYRTEVFFLWKKKLIIRFFGVKFTRDYNNVAIIPTLFRDHSRNSKKPNFSSFFRLLTVIPK